MATYTCPTCGAKMERDLTLFTDHTDQHIVEEVKKRHPNWVTPDGFCPQCLEYFKKALRDPATLAAAEASEYVNLDPAGIRQRQVLGIVGLVLGMLALSGLRASDAPRAWRLALFLPFFIGALGFVQARKKFCVVIAQGQGLSARSRALRLVGLSMVLSALLTAIVFVLD